jgi:hypothetical protein
MGGFSKETLGEIESSRVRRAQCVLRRFRTIRDVDVRDEAARVYDTGRRSSGFELWQTALVNDDCYERNRRLDCVARRLYRRRAARP